MPLEKLRIELLKIEDLVSKSKFDDAELLANHYLETLSNLLINKTKNALTNAEDIKVLQRNRLRTLIQKATIDRLKGNYKSAIEISNQVIESADEYNLIDLKSKAWNIIGIVYFFLGQFDLTLEYLTKTFNYCEEFGTKEELASSMMNLGSIYTTLGLNDKALNFFKEVLKTQKETGNKTEIAKVYSNFALVYHNLRQFKKVVQYNEKSLDIHLEIDNLLSAANVMGNLGIAYQELKNHKKAEVLLEKSLEISKKFGAKTSNAILNLGSFYADKRLPSYDLIKAKRYLLKAKTPSIKNDDKHALLRIYHHLSKLYESENDHLRALQYLKKYYVLESENNIEKTKKQTEQLDREKEVEVAKALSEAKLQATMSLLHKVLPESIATRMINGDENIADYFPSVSILFADIQGFTSISANMEASVVVQFLNFVFEEFDKIMKKYGCEKIKTIGDGYLAIAGAPIECENHAEKLVAAALNMQENIILPEHIRAQIPKGTQFGIRVGIHTGSIVAGVIGQERFVYDVHSDAVNLASRMESLGKVDKVHVTSDFVNHLQNRFELTKNTNHGYKFISRGEIEVKGKGMMETYFIEK